MEELKVLLENVSDSYYDFVRAMLQSASSKMTISLSSLFARIL